MGSAWTDPKTWTAGMVVDEVDLNTYLRDNMNALKDPPFQQIVTATAGNIDATASTAIPITGDLEITLTTHGGAVQWGFMGRFTSTNQFVFNVEYNGTAWSDRPSGIRRIAPSVDSYTMGGWITGLSSGSHTFVPTWKQPNSNTMRLLTSGEPVVFWVREIS